MKGLQTQGAVVLCLLGLGWLLSYAVRRRELRERRRRGTYQYFNAFSNAISQYLKAVH